MEDSMIEQLPLLVTAFANQMRETSQKAAESLDDNQATRPHHDIGPIGTAARLVGGLLLVGLIVYGQLSSSGHLTLITWVAGLIGFPALVLAWHYWRIRRNPARFTDTSALSFVLSLALPVALYLTGWFVPPLWFTSDATLIFVGSSLLLAALRGDAGCEFLALSNWLLRRSDQLERAVFTPIDSLDQRGPRS
ncbi:MAG TPA: hypothetical protein VF043_08520 [Ktedonobacteraceae bacterium]